jgi:hypothetical protein
LSAIALPLYVVELGSLRVGADIERGKRRRPSPTHTGGSDTVTEQVAEALEGVGLLLLAGPMPPVCHQR